MKYVSVFDIVGPIMVGPSSSHTAGAVRIGLMAGKIYKNKPQKVKFTLYNSFAKTGHGHGTPYGLVAGVLGFNVDDSRIKNSIDLAKQEGINLEFDYLEDMERHPNAVDVEFFGDHNLSVQANSVGAGEISVKKINDFNVNLSGNYPTLLLVYSDRPGMISKVTGIIQTAEINIATLNCDREAKGETATMTICTDTNLSEDLVKKIEKLPNIYLVRNIEPLQR